MAGWDLKRGDITEYNVSEDRIWDLFAFVFSDYSKKRNTYKFGIVKSLLDNLPNGEVTPEGIRYTYRDIFEKFTKNYWNLIVKYRLQQMKPDDKSIHSKVESIILETVEENRSLALLEFDEIDDSAKKKIIRSVTRECKKYVFGALYADFDGIIYSFDLAEDGITLNRCVYDYMVKNKEKLAQQNWRAWTHFLEKLNGESISIRLTDL